MIKYFFALSILISFCHSNDDDILPIIVAEPPKLISISESNIASIKSIKRPHISLCHHGDSDKPFPVIFIVPNKAEVEFMLANNQYCLYISNMEFNEILTIIFLHFKTIKMKNTLMKKYYTLTIHDNEENVEYFYNYPMNSMFADLLKKISEQISSKSANLITGIIKRLE